MKRSTAFVLAFAASFGCGADGPARPSAVGAPSSAYPPTWLRAWIDRGIDEATWVSFDEDASASRDASVLETGAVIERRVFGRRVVGLKAPPDADFRERVRDLLRSADRLRDDPFDASIDGAAPLLLRGGERALLLLLGPEPGRVRATRGDGRTYVIEGREAFVAIARHLANAREAPPK